jgi:hypothetical protein
MSLRFVNLELEGFDGGRAAGLVFYRAVARASNAMMGSLS